MSRNQLNKAAFCLFRVVQLKSHLQTHATVYYDQDYLEINLIIFKK